MNNLKIGDIIEFTGDALPTETHKAQVRGICGTVIFTRDLTSDGMVVSSTSFVELEDLITWGWIKSEDEIEEIPQMAGTLEALKSIK